MRILDLPSNCSLAYQISNSGDIVSKGQTIYIEGDGSTLTNLGTITSNEFIAVQAEGISIID